MFENYVNYAGSKTVSQDDIVERWFENYVNYAGSKTAVYVLKSRMSFENYVNYAGSKTRHPPSVPCASLRTM